MCWDGKGNWLFSGRQNLLKGVISYTHTPLIPNIVDHIPQQLHSFGVMGENCVNFIFWLSIPKIRSPMCSELTQNPISPISQCRFEAEEIKKQWSPATWPVTPWQVWMWIWLKSVELLISPFHGGWAWIRVDIQDVVLHRAGSFRASVRPNVNKLSIGRGIELRKKQSKIKTWDRRSPIF